MPITEAFSGSETVSTTEWDLTTDTPGPDADTADGSYAVMLDLSALAAGDVFSLRAYERVVGGGTQRVVWEASFADVQAEPHWLSPWFNWLHGGTFTLLRRAGTDRSITWSIRKYG